MKKSSGGELGEKHWHSWRSNIDGRQASFGLNEDAELSIVFSCSLGPGFLY